MKTKILSIDDSKAVHVFIKSCLAEQNVEVYDAFDGNEGLKMLFEADKSFDLILLDFEMPNLDGLGTLREIKKRTLLTPVVMLTSKNSVEDISLMLETGAAEYIMKPFTPDILVSKIEAVLGRTLA